MKIAIIGAGKVGTALGKGFAAKGHEVVFGARDGRELHEGMRASSVRGAVESSEVVVLATPWNAAADALKSAGDLGGRVLVDATNPVGPGFSYAAPEGSSAAEEIARLSPNARVVKAFNTMAHETMSNPRFGERRAAMYLAGDDEGARSKVATLASDLGFEPVALPKLSHARALEAIAMVWIRTAIALGQGRQNAFAIVRRGEHGKAAPRTETPRTIAIVGTGNIGGALAKAWLRAGHRVRLAVRDRDAAELRELVGLGAEAVALEGAANGVDVVVLAVPAASAIGVVDRIGDLAGKIVVDCTNAIGAGLTVSPAAEALQAHLPKAHVVKSFNQQGAETLRDPYFAGGIAAVDFVAGDDAAARTTVLGLARDVGLDAVDAGPLAAARFLEWITVAWIATSQSIGTRDFGLALLRR
ncbi:MAG: NADPH-dependent F420 reductase [Polyangiales bacterium]